MGSDFRREEERERGRERGRRRIDDDGKMTEFLFSLCLSFWERML
jgi:hypothetical protein